MGFNSAFKGLRTRIFVNKNELYKQLILPNHLYTRCLDGTI